MDEHGPQGDGEDDGRRLVTARIRRQRSPGAPQYYEAFQIRVRPTSTVLDLLEAIQLEPTNWDGGRTTPIVFERSCREEACGICAMVINNQVRQACATFVRELEEPITVEPLTKFPVLRDLVVDRRRMFDRLADVRPYIQLDGSQDDGFHWRMGRRTARSIQSLGRCISCGACVEVCPQYHEKSPFVGAFALARVAKLGLHPIEQLHQEERLHSVMGVGGITYCSNAQNCHQACPTGVPLLDAIGAMNKDTTLLWLKQLFET